MLDTRPRERLSAEEAREIVLRAQMLDGEPAPGGNVNAMLSHLGAVQLDTISVLARSHELVAYARLGPVPRAVIEQAYWAEPARTFEYIGHAGCIMPVELWPYFAFRRRMVRIAQDRRAPAELVEEVRARLHEGPVTTSELGGARPKGGWWNWSPAKMALEGLYRRGEVAVTVRRGWLRVYDLPERVLPPELLAREASDEECYAYLVRVAARALGVGTADDIANYFHLNTRYHGAAANSRRLIAAAIEAAGLVPVTVEGWTESAFADPVALAAPPAQPTRATLISPFDSLVWATPRPGEYKHERERIRRVFGFSYAFEAYVRKEERQHGYFVMPLLAGGRLVGWVDPRREGHTLVAANLSLVDGEYVEAMAAALIEAAAWVSCDSVRIDRADPQELAEPLRRLVEK